MKTHKTKRQILRDARRHLRNGWIQGNWCVFETERGSKAWSNDDSWEDLLGLIDESKRFNPNPKCAVCAEGAVYLACAMDGDTEPDRTQGIINVLDGLTEGDSIISVNDDDYEGEDAIHSVLKVFDAAELVLADD